MKKLIGVIGIAFIAFTMSFISTANAQEDSIGSGGEDCSFSQDCEGGICSILNAKKRFLANGCKKKCDFTCTVQGLPNPF